MHKVAAKDKLIQAKNSLERPSSYSTSDCLISALGLTIYYWSTDKYYMYWMLNMGNHPAMDKWW